MELATIAQYAEIFRVVSCSDPSGTKSHVIRKPTNQAINAHLSRMLANGWCLDTPYAQRIFFAHCAKKGIFILEINAENESWFQPEFVARFRAEDPATSKYLIQVNPISVLRQFPKFSDAEKEELFALWRKDEKEALYSDTNSRYELSKFDVKSAQ